MFFTLPAFHDRRAQAKDAAAAKTSYEKAKTALVAYLEGTKLEPLGDPAYAQ